MSLNPGLTVPGAIPAYSAGWISPKVCPADWARRARSAAHSGDTALVPPMIRSVPSTLT